ncbi:DUF3817 domain-containing protein [Thiomicrospira sp. S5]|jgi:integral membrane protein|uniref:DUF3817 domain-containing protein n=1 Tax=Thiomicrospira sp. S5 TaxID=1803865 RepID=UPI000F8A0E42|nr:DUF3817 domain-containing protein [Thiomicrospira sp. S5]AZR82136.1 hypothetical protein AYJ59_07470 [Thiomicrospira sp. S5]
MNSHLKLLYWLALLDGIALLLLVFVAVPIKYQFDWPYAVKVLGPTHGVLFISLTLTMLTAVSKKLIRPGLGALIFVAALIPLGAFYADYRLKKAVTQA